MNVDLLRRIQRHILEDPARVNMAVGMATYRAAVAGARHSDDHAPECGAVCCIAGLAVMLSDETIQVREWGGTYWDHVQRRAVDLLDLSFRIPPSRLFLVGHWPIHWHERLDREIPGTLAYGQVVCDYIDYFIESEVGQPEATCSTT